MIHETEIINGIEIDVGMAPLIKMLWAKKIETFQCCQGGNVNEKKAFGTYVGRKDGVHREMAHLIFHKRHLQEIRKYLPSSTEYIVGDREADVQKDIRAWLGGFDAVWAQWKPLLYQEEVV